MNLDYNLIEVVHDWAFHGSQIARLSMKGNRGLRVIGEDAFTGLMNIRKLDLSETSITKLPTKGLEDLEVLKLVDTFSFKSFPSVYHFKFIKEAQLTYPYHCCAFKFPATHDPQEYARHQSFKEDMEKKYCEPGTTPAYYDPFAAPKATIVRRSAEFVKFRNTIHHTRRSSGHFAVRQTRSLTWPNHPEVFRVGPGSSEWGNIEATQHSVQENGEYGHVVYTPSWPDNSSQIWSGLFGAGPGTSSSIYMGVFRTSNIHDAENEVEGTFHHTTVSHRPEHQLQAFCGTLVKDYRDVKCAPESDAFNPCEDVMGNVGLRVAVWFVVVASVLGNLAVMVVLMSTRFTMSVSKFLMCNLAFADFCMGFYLLIIAAMDVHTIGVYFNYAIDWQHGSGCKIAGFITVFASELSIFTLTVITLERWYAITYAIHLNKRLKLGMAAKIMVCGWLYAITMATLPLMGISGYTKTSICLPMENKDSRDLAYLITLLSINGLAFLLICACYGKMYFSIIQQQSRATTNDMTVAKRMAMLVFTDFACWAPIAFFGLTAVAGYPLINVTNSKILLVFFYPLNSCANPFLYAILTKQYRRDFFILLSRYGFCTKRAMRYKGTYSCNTMPRLPSGQPNCCGSLYAQGSFENGKGHVARENFDDGTRSISSTLDILVDTDTTYEVVRIGSERRKEDRKLSIVGEDSQPSSEEERSSSPMHKGSPHPIKNSYTKLNVPNLEQAEILKRVLGEEDTGKDCIMADIQDFSHDAEMLLWPRTNMVLPVDNSGFISSPNSTVDTEI